VDGATAKSAIQHKTLVDAVTEQVRLQLITGTIPPGQRILVRDLCKEFEVSQIPIREALRRLEAEGLIVTLPQRGAVAADVSVEDLESIWFLRRVIESGVARRSAQRAEPSHIDAAAEALEALRLATSDFHSAAFRDAHRSFHWAILAPGSSGVIRRILEQLWRGSDRYIQLFFTYVAADMHQFIADHEALAAAFTERDPDLLESLLLDHITHTEVEVRAGLLAGRSVSDG
jgi:DNA-binding GntR family transcriptional regulator